jgi:hypothetical protein
MAGQRQRLVAAAAADVQCARGGIRCDAREQRRGQRADGALELGVVIGPALPPSPFQNSTCAWLSCIAFPPGLMHIMRNRERRA